MDHHETAAAEIARDRICDGHGESDRHRGINRIATTLEDIDADARRACFLRHHHAVTAERFLRGRDRRLLRVGGDGEEKCNNKKREADDHSTCMSCGAVPAKAGPQSSATYR